MSQPKTIFVLKDGQRLGPFAIDDLFDQLEDGVIEYDDTCLRRGESELERVRDILEGDLLTGPEPEPEPRIPEKPVAQPEPEEPSESEWAPETDWEAEEDNDEKEEDGDGIIDDGDFEPEPAELVAGPPADPKAILYAGHPSYLSFPKSLFLIVLSIGLGVWLRENSGWYFLGGLVVALFAVSWILLERSMRLYLITPKRCELITGLIAKNSNEVRIEDIRTINVVKKGLPGLFGVGSVEFDSSGGSSVEVTFEKVWAADRIKGLVRRLQDAMDG